MSFYSVETREIVDRNQYDDVYDKDLKKLPIKWKHDLEVYLRMRNICQTSKVRGIHDIYEAFHKKSKAG